MNGKRLVIFAQYLLILAVLFAVVLLWRVPAARDSEFHPHGMCFLWREDLIAFYALANGIVAMAYFAIPALLILLLKRQGQYLPSKTGTLGFAVFITFCGFTHVMKIITIWEPVYWTTILLDWLTAFSSVTVAIGLAIFLRRLEGLSDIQASLREIQSRQDALEERSREG